MILYAVATVDNPQQRDNLCECIEILGGVANTSFSDVVLEYEGSKEECEKFIELFEQYPRHGIFTED